MIHPLSNYLITELVESDWQRYRDIRLRSLADSEESFGGSLADESQWDEAAWRRCANKYIGLVAVKDGVDVAVMTVEKMQGDHGATCWIGGCWTDPQFRGQGALRSLFEYVDQQSALRGWEVQGLGVWESNFAAQNAYKNLGFEPTGTRKESTRKPGTFYIQMARKTR